LTKFELYNSKRCSDYIVQTRYLRNPEGCARSDEGGKRNSQQNYHWG